MVEGSLTALVKARMPKLPTVAKKVILKAAVMLTALVKARTPASSYHGKNWVIKMKGR
jgi:hypothetical protein